MRTYSGTIATWTRPESISQKWDKAQTTKNAKSGQVVLSTMFRRGNHEADNMI